VYFAPPLKGFPLELDVGAGVKTRIVGLLGREKRLTIYPAIWIQSTNMTDRRTDTGRQQRPCLRIASRGKNSILFLPFSSHSFWYLPTRSREDFPTVALNTPCSEKDRLCFSYRIIFSNDV